MNRITRMFCIIAVACALLIMSACGNSSDCMTKETKSASDVTPPTTAPPKVPTEVFPASGQKHGVVRHTLKLNHGMYLLPRYKCADGLKSVDLNFLAGIDYDGTAIKFTQDDDSFGMPVHKTSLNDQLSVTITFKGDYKSFASHVVSAIVISDYYWDKTELMSPTDVVHKVVNLTPDMIDSGIMLNSSDFAGGGYINKLTFCVQP